MLLNLDLKKKKKPLCASNLKGLLRVNDLPLLNLETQVGCPPSERREWMTNGVAKFINDGTD